MSSPTCKRITSFLLLFPLLGTALHCGSDQGDGGTRTNAGIEQGLDSGSVGEVSVDSVAIYVRRGRTYMRDKEYSRAILPLTSAVRLNSESAKAQDLLGLTYAFRLEPGKAIEHIEKAIAVEPDNGTFHMHLGKAYMLKTDYVGATEAYERAIELGLKKGKPHYDLGIIAEREGRLEEAGEHYRKAMQVAPRFAPTCNLRFGILAEKAGDDMKAIGLYSKAINRNPRLETAHYRIALLYASGGRYELAEQHMKQFQQLKGRIGAME